ncbi:flotillin-like protein FloA [Verrucomicrobia bacterium]|nr:flotillin-like protein FloA [Verrucomicrobiota bacterium]
MDLINWIIIGVLVVVGLVVTLVILSFFTTWLKALLAKAPVGFPTLLAMRLRGVPVGLIVDARVTAVKASLPLTTDQLEAHYLAEGNVVQTVQAIIAAAKANIELSWDRACAIDLATRGTSKSVLEAVRTSINPKVIDCVIEGRETIDGVAKDGIQVKVRARVTVRSNLDRYVGSAQEETVIARVGESIVSTIGSSENYKIVLENPNAITEKVLDRGLDQGTAFEILSIDIADVDLGENRGAALRSSQASADKEVAQAQAEIRRAAAVALEQENRAKVEEMQAKLVEAEAQVPMAMAEAFRNGNLGIMDYYKMRNVEADTEMRSSISKGTE